MMEPKTALAVSREAARCDHCKGNLILEPHTEWARSTREPFVQPPEGQRLLPPCPIGFEIKCLACGQPWSVRPYVTVAELVMLWGMPPQVARAARWSDLSFLWRAS